MFADHHGFILENNVCVLCINSRYIIGNLHYIPIHSECIAFTNIDVRLQRQEIYVPTDNLLCFAKHLGFRNPQCRGGYGNGEIVNLYAIELLNAHLDGIHFLKANECLPVMAFTNDFILQATQGEIGLREEITRATGWVKECERSQAVLIGIEFLLALAFYLFFQYFIQFMAQVIEEKGIYDLVDVLDGSVVHTATTTCLWV